MPITPGSHNSSSNPRRPGAEADAERPAPRPAPQPTREPSPRGARSPVPADDFGARPDVVRTPRAASPQAEAAALTPPASPRSAAVFAAQASGMPALPAGGEWGWPEGWIPPLPAASATARSEAAAAHGPDSAATAAMRAAVMAWARAPTQPASELRRRAAAAEILLDSLQKPHGVADVHLPASLGGLTSLPEGLQIGGNFSIDGYLGALPKGLQVHGNFELLNSPHVSELAEDCWLGGGVVISNCASFARLAPDGFLPQTFTGHVVLSNCKSLQKLENDLEVQGRLHIDGCANFRGFGARTEVESLITTGCNRLMRLPDDMGIATDIRIISCSRFESLGERESIGGTLELQACGRMVDFPPRLFVAGNLFVRQCERVESLGEAIAVDGYCGISGCDSLSRLPASMGVGGDCEIVDCPSLTALSKSGRFLANLDILQCTALEVIEGDVSVGDHLFVTDCDALRSIRGNVRVGEGMVLADNSLLAELPADITSWEPRAGGALREIAICNCGFSVQDLQAMTTRVFPGVYFDITESHGVDGSRFENLYAAISFWVDAVDLTALSPQARAGVPTLLQLINTQVPETEDVLMTYLSRLVDTAEYAAAAARPQLALRVLGLLQAMGKSEDVRQYCMDELHVGLTSCDDRIIFQLGQIETALMVRAASAGSYDEAKLKELGLGMMRIALVHEAAAAHCKDFPNSDPIEVYLFFETRLREPLALPLATQTMIFSNSAEVSEEKLAAVLHTVGARAQDVQGQAAFLQQWAPWQQHGRSKQVEAFRWQELSGVEPAALAGQELICFFTQEPLHKLERPVLYQQSGAWRACEAEAFLTWWKEHGTEPLLLQPIALEALARPA